MKSLIMYISDYKYKHIFDVIMIICGCIFGALVLVPLVFVIISYIWLNDKGPIFYCQRRVGKNGKEFNMIKFRTMIVDAEKNSGPRLVSIDDDRITRPGKILRKFKLDELPQIINVLCGDMSIVGPRPERPEMIKIIKNKIPQYDDRLTVLPGLTGIAQIYGTDPGNFDKKLQYDRIYIKNSGLMLDIKLIVITCIKLIKGL